MTFFKRNDSRGLTVTMDHRERPSGIDSILTDWGVSVNVTTLEIGDYAISEKVCVERKASADFVTSLFDGRLFAQAVQLTDAYEKPVWLVEGDIGARPGLANALYGALLSLQLDYGISVLFPPNVAESARIIRLLCRREQSAVGGHVHVSKPKKPKSTADLQLYLVSSFPRWSGEIAHRALLKAVTPRRLFSYTEEQLCGVDGIGKKRADDFARILDSEYGGGKS